MSFPPEASINHPAHDPTLPDGWIKEFDQTHQTWYYVNTHKNPPKSTWTHPLERDAVTQHDLRSSRNTEIVVVNSPALSGGRGYDYGHGNSSYGAPFGGHYYRSGVTFGPQIGPVMRHGPKVGLIGGLGYRPFGGAGFLRWGRGGRCRGRGRW